MRAGIKHLGTRAPGAKGPSTYRRQRDVELFRFIGPAGRPISETGRYRRWYLNIGDGTRFHENSKLLQRTAYTVGARA